MKIFVDYNGIKVDVEITPNEIGDLLTAFVNQASTITPRQVVLGKTLQNALMNKIHSDTEHDSNTETQ